MTPSDRDLRHEIAGRIGYRLRQLRKARGWRLQDVALRLDMEPGHVGRHERGDRCPQLWSLSLYADVYGVSVTEIVSVMDDCYRYAEAS